jgi:hypothetical protein
MSKHRSRSSGSSSGAPKPAELEDRTLTRQALIVVPLVMAAGLGGLFAYDRFHATHGKGEGLALVRLGDDTLLAVEAVSISATTHDVNTGIQQDSGWTDYRLRTIDVHTGRVIATRAVWDEATCRAAHGRAWCWWKGKLRLLDRELAIVADDAAWRHDALRSGYDLKSAVVESGGELALLSNDGHRVRLDPTTLAITVIPFLASRSEQGCSGGLVPSLAIGRAHYQLGGLGAPVDDERVPLEEVSDLIHPKVLAPDVTWLGGSFVDTACSPTAPVDAMFIVSRTRLDKQSARQLSRVRVDGTVAWTVSLPEPPASAFLLGDALAVSGSAYLVVLDNGVKRWQLHH